MSAPIDNSPYLPRTAAKRALWSLGRRAFSRKRFREWLNHRYRDWSFPAQRRFYRLFAKAFRDGSDKVAPGEWHVDFAGRTITLPLRAERMWLDWDNALSLLGHDTEVKQTYAAILRSASAPVMFVDIGANYGLHSLMFLVHGVKTLAFEPNPECHADFELLCAANRVATQLEGVALGAQPGEVELLYPERDTWLGVVRQEPPDAADPTLSVLRVRRAILDDYLDRFPSSSVLIKVDTEGSEHDVLSGGRRTLRTVRPLVIFESLRDDRRVRLYDLLTESDYAIANLPWDPRRPHEKLSAAAFTASRAENFIAIPLSTAAPAS